MPASSLEKHHSESKERVAEVLERLGLPANKCLLVGSASISHQLIQQYSRRRPGDLDFYIEDSEVWEKSKTVGTEVPGPIGGSVVQITLDGVEIEFFHRLPGFPERRLKKVFERAEWKHGVLCMSLMDISIWKWYLRRNPDRKEYKRRQDWNDIKVAIKSMFTGMLTGGLQPATSVVASVFNPPVF